MIKSAAVSMMIGLSVTTASAFNREEAVTTCMKALTVETVVHASKEGTEYFRVHPQSVFANWFVSSLEENCTADLRISHVQHIPIEQRYFLENERALAETYADVVWFVMFPWIDGTLSEMDDIFESLPDVQSIE